MPNPSLSVRIGSTGKAELRNDFADIRKDGVQTQEEIAAASEAAAKRATSAYQRAADDMAAADRRRAAAADKIAAMAPQTSVQYASLVGAQPAGGLSGLSAQQSAAAIRELLKAEDDLAARTHALQMAYDPLYAAQIRYNQAVKNSSELLAAGRITQQMHQSVLAQEEAALAKAKQGVEGHSSALGFNRLQAITAQSAVMRFTDSIIAGQSPLRAFALEAHKAGEVVALDDNGLAGGLAKVRALINPVTVGIAAATAVVILGAAAWYSYANAIDKLNAVALGSGRILGETGAQLEANAEAAARAGDMTIGTARSIEEGYLRIAKSGDVLVGLTALTQNFAAATGQDAKAAQQELVAAFSDTEAGAQSLAEKYGVLTTAQQERIDKLVREGDLLGAQRELLKDLNGAFDGAADHAAGFSLAITNIGHAADYAYNALGRFLSQHSNSIGSGIAGFLPGGAAGYDLLSSYGATPQRMPAFDDAAGIAARAKANASFRSFSGDNRDQFVNQINQDKVALAFGGTAEQLHQYSLQLDANEHALHTWMSTQDKATALARADVAVAAARTPAQKAAAAAERERIQLAGQAVTSAEAQARITAAGAAASDRASKSHDKHAETLRREAESMEVDTRETLKLADAYLQIGQSTLVAEARRKAMTDATKKGIDVEAQVRREVALEIAKGAETAAKAVGHLRDENSIRDEVNDKVAAGTLAAADMNKALSDEAVLRPLLKLRLVAHGEAYEVLTRIIKAYTDALDESHASEARSNAVIATDATTRQASDILALMRFNDDPQRRQIEAARLAAEHEADDHHYEDVRDGDPTHLFRSNFLRSRAALAGAQQSDSQSQYFAQQMRDQRDSLTMTQAELKLVGANDNYRQAELDKLKAILDLKRQGIDPDSADGKAILAGVAALDQEQAKLRAMQGDWQELKGFGDQFIDDVLNTDNWKNWGDFGKMVLNDLMKELEKLALINPLKNWLLGENNPTGGGFLGSLLKLLGGGGGGGFDASSLINPSSLGSAGSLLPDLPLPAFATGTDYAPGGAALVGEQGAEIVALPTGSRVIPAGDTRRMLAANDSRPGPIIFNDFRGAVVTEDLMRQAETRAQQLIDDATPRIAEKGARMAFDARARMHGRIG